MCTVPNKLRGSGDLAAAAGKPITLVALDIAGVDEIYRIGGAQAIAAMALGTETIPRVEKIVGRNVRHRGEMLLRDESEIDFRRGRARSILADARQNPTFVAADILPRPSTIQRRLCSGHDRCGRRGCGRR